VRLSSALWLAASIATVELGAQPAPPPCAARRADERVALVLSGGGARALAHIGVLEVLDSLGVRPDLIVGSSMGAIVGALYASGYTGREIDSIARALPLAQLLRSSPARAPVSLAGIHPIVEVEQGEKGFSLQQLARRESDINALLASLLLRGNLLARGRFDALPIPFVAVATDLDNRRPVVLDHGDLAQAVRASYSVPIVFSPMHMQGHVLVDGGIAANVPARVARGAGATRLIISDLTRSDSTLNPDSPLDVSGRLIDFLFEQPGDSAAPGDVRVTSPVDNVGSLEFAARDLTRAIAVGYRTAADVIGPAAACLPHGADPSGRALPTFLVRLTADRGGERERHVLAEYLGVAPGHHFDPAELANALDRISESDRYQAVWLNPTGTADSVAFDASISRSPRRRLALGLAYDEDVGGRLWLGTYGHPWSLRDLVTWALVQAGGLREMAQLGARGFERVWLGRLQPTATATFQQDEIRSYDARQRVIGETKTNDGNLFVGAERLLADGWSLGLGVESRIWSAPRAATLATLGPVLKIRNQLASGETTVRADAAWTPRYQLTAIDVADPIAIGRLTLTPRLRYAIGAHLPLELTFPLGGTEGFPGLRFGNARGDREAMAGTGAAIPVWGPLAIRVELEAGQTRFGGPAIPDGRWLLGARGGVGADTPLGPVRLEYGGASGGQRALFVRLGYWF
jgi:predicted acylesterase/phospholipase RssA